MPHCIRLSMAKTIAVLLLITPCLSLVREEFMIGSAVGVALVAPLIGYLFMGPGTRCHRTECCTDAWVSPNITGLQSALRGRVFGQHLVTDKVLKAVVGHLKNKSPKKALALAFNGWKGSGKNFVSRIITEHIFKKGMSSRYVHQFIASRDFSQQADFDFYKRQLRNLVEHSVSDCSRSLFIFDEMDKMPIGLIDALKPYLDYYTQVGGVDFRKSMFIFLSNTAGHLINSVVLKHWKKGKKREDIGIEEIEKVINLGEFNSKGGFWHSSLIEKDLINYFIPFLPLERSHIRMCAKADLEEKGHPVTEQILNSVADKVSYFPKDLKAFSQTGCKKVWQKVEVSV